MHTHDGYFAGSGNGPADAPEDRLRDVLGASGQRYTEQRAAVYRYLCSTRSHPTADDVFTAVRTEIPDISLATVYKALETLVGCQLAMKLAYADGSALSPMSPAISTPPRSAGSVPSMASRSAATASS
jgi:hypothetical protein